MAITDERANQECTCGHLGADHREKREGLTREICLEDECPCLQFKQTQFETMFRAKGGL